jgi:hypothetical protein
MNSVVRHRAKVLAVLAVVLLAFLAMRLPQQTRAQSIETAPPPPDRAFSAMAFAFGQTARVNIAQIGDPSFPAGTACGIIVNYFGAEGFASGSRTIPSAIYNFTGRTMVFLGDPHI